MTWIADMVARGVSPRQHYDPDYDENLRIVTYSGRVAPSTEIAEDWDAVPGTVGDDLSHALWRQRKGRRKMPGWSPAWSAIVSGAKGSSSPGSSTPPRWYLYPDKGRNVADERFEAKEPQSPSFAYPSWATRFPSDWTGIVNAGATEVEQRDIFHPDFLGLVAGNRGVRGYSTRVLDMDGGQLDTTYSAELSSIFSVEEIIAASTPFLQTGKYVALQLGQSGQGDLNGAGLMNLGWNNGGAKNLLCLSGTVGGPFVTPAHPDVQIGTARGGVRVFPATMSTDVLWNTQGTGLLGPLEFHGNASIPLPLQPNLPSGLVQSLILWKPKPISPSTLISTNLNTPGSWQIWTAVPYITRPRPTTGTITRPGFGNIPVIQGAGPVGTGPRIYNSPVPRTGNGGGSVNLQQIVLPNGQVIQRVQRRNAPGRRRNPLGGFGIPGGGGGGSPAGPPVHTQNPRPGRDNSATAKAARLRRKLKEGRERRAEKRADRDAKRADRRAKNPRGRKARERREQRRKDKEGRKERRRERKEEREGRRTKKRDDARRRREERRRRRKEKEGKRRKKAKEVDRKRRRAGQNPGIPLFPRIAQGGYNPPPSQVFPGTLGTLGGVEFIANPFRPGEPDITGMAAGDMGEADIELLMAAACVGSFVGYGSNPTGGWGSGSYTDRERSRGDGSIALLGAGASIGAILRGEPRKLALGRTSMMYPLGESDITWGQVDPASGGAKNGARMGAGPAGGVVLEVLDGTGNTVGVDYTAGEPGHIFNGKTTMNGRLDPWTVEFTDRVGLNDIPSGAQGFRFDSAVNATHPLFTHSAGPQVTDVVAFLSDLGGGGVGTSRLLSVTAGVDLLAVANTLLYTVPIGESAVITRAVFVPTTITGAITATPRCGVGTNAGADDVIASQRLPGLTVGKAYSFNVAGESEVGNAAETFSWGVDTAAGGAAAVTGTVFLSGYFLSDVPGGGTPGADSSAIHVNVAAEITGIANAAPALADVMVYEDASDVSNKKHCTLTQLQTLIGGGGVVAQVAFASLTPISSTSLTLPIDSTSPQTAEMFEIATLQMTPVDGVNNNITTILFGNMGAATARIVCLAMFDDAGVCQAQDLGRVFDNVGMVSLSTVETAFTPGAGLFRRRFRIGGDGANAKYINRNGNGDTMGATFGGGALMIEWTP